MCNDWELVAADLTNYLIAQSIYVARYICSSACPLFAKSLDKLWCLPPENHQPLVDRAFWSFWLGPLDGSIDLLFVQVERVIEVLKVDLHRFFISVCVCLFGRQMTVGRSLPLQLI